MSVGFITWFLGIAYVLLIGNTALVVILENRQASKTIAWLLVLIFLPLIGWIFFYFFGQNQRKNYRLTRKNYRLIKRRMLEMTSIPSERNLPEEIRPLVQLFESESAAVLTGGNQLQLLPTGADFIASLLKAIKEAKAHVHIESYIFADDAVGHLVRDALFDKAKEGIEVRVVYDDVGCWRVKAAFFKEMEAAGILVGAFLPVRFPQLTSKVTYRDHHKIAVIDGRIGFIGGMNLATRYVTSRGGEWRDMHLRIEGEAVGGLQRLFLCNWYFTTNRLRIEKRFFPLFPHRSTGSLAQIVYSTPMQIMPKLAMGVSWIATNAQRYLYITTPYFMPTEPVLQALQTAALSGIDVRLLLPQKPDAFWLRYGNETFFDDMLEAGVRIFLYPQRFMHAKVIVADDALCSIGSANMDFRSFENNFEANAFCYDAAIATQLRQLLQHDMQDATEVLRSEWQQRPFYRRMLESFTRILSPLL